MNQSGQKILLPRSGPDSFVTALRDTFDEDDRRAWRRLGMLALRESAGWPLELIAASFGHHQAYVSRCLKQVRREVKQRLAESDSY